MWVPRDADAGATALREVLLDPVDVDKSDRPADRVEDGDRTFDETSVAVLFEPVEGRAGGPCAVEARSADEDDLIGGIQDSSRRGLEYPGSGVEADEVVVPLEQMDDAVELRLADRLRDPRVVVGGDDLEPARRL